jgi:hypothetical protein
MSGFLADYGACFALAWTLDEGCIGLPMDRLQRLPKVDRSRPVEAVNAGIP